MSNENYTPFGEEWKKEISKLPKSAIIELAAKLGQEKSDFENSAKNYKDLSNKIAECYGKEDENGDWIDNEDSDLGTIGEITARHFKWL